MIHIIAKPLQTISRISPRYQICNFDNYSNDPWLLQEFPKHHFLTKKALEHMPGDLITKLYEKIIPTVRLFPNGSLIRNRS